MVSLLLHLMIGLPEPRLTLMIEPDSLSNRARGADGEIAVDVSTMAPRTLWLRPEPGENSRTVEIAGWRVRALAAPEKSRELGLRAGLELLIGFDHLRGHVLVLDSERGVAWLFDREEAKGADWAAELRERTAGGADATVSRLKFDASGDHLRAEVRVAGSVRLVPAGLYGMAASLPDLARGELASYPRTDGLVPTSVVAGLRTPALPVVHGLRRPLVTAGALPGPRMAVDLTTGEGWLLGGTPAWGLARFLKSGYGLPAGAYAGTGGRLLWGSSSSRLPGRDPAQGWEVVSLSGRPVPELLRELEADPAALGRWAVGERGKTRTVRLRSPEGKEEERALEPVKED